MYLGDERARTTTSGGGDTEQQNLSPPPIAKTASILSTAAFVRSDQGICGDNSSGSDGGCFDYLKVLSGGGIQQSTASTRL